MPVFETWWRGGEREREREREEGRGERNSRERQGQRELDVMLSSSLEERLNRLLLGYTPRKWSSILCGAEKKLVTHKDDVTVYL